MLFGITENNEYRMLTMEGWKSGTMAIKKRSYITRTVGK